MALTYTGRRNNFGNLCNNSASATLSLADTLMNDSEKRIISAKDWPFLWRQYTLSSIASTVTVTIASPGVFTLTNHGFSVGTALYFTTTGALPTGITAGTTYYVITAGLTANAFQVSTTIGGTTVNTTGTQSGTHTVYTQRYSLPAYTQRPQSVYVTVGNYRYTPKEVTNRSDWDRINQTQIASNIPTDYFIYDGAVEIFPRPTTASVVSINARMIATDLSFADYTAGTVDIVTNGSTLVTGSGTSWSAPMIGRWIRITPSNTATASGDGYWYQVDAVPSSTTMVLRKAYMGASLTTGAGAAYTLGEMSLIPEPHDQLPVFEALKIYFTSVDPNTGKAQLYDKMFKENYAQMVRDYGSKLNVVLDDGDGATITNSNLLLTL